MFLRGLITLLIVITGGWLIWFVHQNILFPFFISPIFNLLSAALAPLTHFWITWLIIYAVGTAMIVAAILILGWLSSIQVLTRLTKRFSFILKIPAAGKIIGLLIEVFEHKNESKFGYIIEVQDNLFGRGKWPGIITNEYEIDGVTLCNIYILWGWAGLIKREVKRSDLVRIVDATWFNFLIFHMSFGSRDPFIGKKRTKLD